MTLSIFVGAVVSGFAGFAFSAVAGAVLLHMLPPSEAVPFMMICSLLLQIGSMVSLRRRIQWRDSRMLILGGLVGLPPALYLLQRVDATSFRIGFGIFLTAYAGYMLARPALRRLWNIQGPLYDAGVGLAGGLLGGLTAMPSAMPTIWCDLRGVAKDRQRGIVQPYIATMQVAALAFLAMQDGLPEALVAHVLSSLVPLAAGAFVGLALFGKVNDQLFRRAVLCVLLVSGVVFFA
jgi:uncharacterized membrane protein YfcA